VSLASPLAPWEMADRDGKEAWTISTPSSLTFGKTARCTDLFESSTMPASALYQPKRADKRPKAPSRDDAVLLGASVVVLQVADAQHEEGEIEREE